MVVAHKLAGDEHHPLYLCYRVMHCKLGVVVDNFKFSIYIVLTLMFFLLLINLTD